MLGDGDTVPLIELEKHNVGDIVSRALKETQVEMLGDADAVAKHDGLAINPVIGQEAGHVQGKG